MPSRVDTSLKEVFVPEQGGTITVSRRPRWRSRREELAGGTNVRSLQSDHMLLPHELEGIRRSLAMSPTVPADRVRELLETCDVLLTERIKIRRLLRDLGPSWRDTRKALNELATVLEDTDRRASADGRP